MRMFVLAGALSTSASFVAALTSRPGRDSCMGGMRREKGIVVSVAPAGPMSGADLQFRPGSSGTQHRYKRMRTSIAQRVAPIRNFAKVELCKGNEGMTHAHARATRTAVPPHHRPCPACRWQRAPRPVPRCPHRQCSCHQDEAVPPPPPPNEAGGKHVSVCVQSSGHTHHPIPTHWEPPVAMQTTVSERFVANARASAAAPSSPIELPDNPRNLSVRLAMSASANIAAPAAPIPLFLR